MYEHLRITIFEKYSIQAEKKLVSIQNTIKQDAMSAKQVSSETGTRQESYKTYREVSDSDWYNPFSYGRTRTVSTTNYKTVSYTYANVHNAVNKLEEFVLNTSQVLFAVCEEAIDLASFRNDIKSSIKGMFDFNDESFDADMILLPLNNAVERITIPSVDLDLDKYINTIREQFTANEIEGDEIAHLRNEQSRVVSILLTEIGKELKNSIQSIVEKLKAEETQFIPSLTKDLEDNVKQLKEDLENKEKSLADYDAVLILLKEDLV